MNRSARWSAQDIPALGGKMALVTGANRGLGLEIATRLAAAGAEVELGCRDLEKGRGAVEAIREAVPRAKVSAALLDLADLKSVRSYASGFCARHAALDLLCHNAGAVMIPTFQKTRDGFELQMGTNHLGAFALTGLLLERLAAAPRARVIHNTSMAHRMTQGIDPEDLSGARSPYRVMDAYGRSKLASLLFAFELARRLEGAGLRVLSVAAHPGIANTNPGAGSLAMRIIGALLAQSPAMGALPALYAATAEGVRNGDFFGPDGFNQLRGFPRQVDCHPRARDAQLAAKIWSASERLTAVSYLS